MEIPQGKLVSKTNKNPLRARNICPQWILLTHVVELGVALVIVKVAVIISS